MMIRDVEEGNDRSQNETEGIRSTYVKQNE